MDKIQTVLILIYAASLPLSMTLSWVILIIGMVLLLAQISFDLFKNKRSNIVASIKSAPLLGPLLIFLFAVGISGLVNGGALEAVASIGSLKALTCYLWAYSVFSRYRYICYQAVLILLLVGAVAGVFGAVEQIGNIHLGYRYLQGTGFLGGPMAFAGQMQLLALLSIAILLVGKGCFISTTEAFTQPAENTSASTSARASYLHLPVKLTWTLQTLFLLLVTGNCLGIIFAAERSGWAGFAVGLFVVSLIVSWRYFAITFVSALSLATCGWFFIPVFQKRLLPLLCWQNDVSIKVRFFLWQQAIQLWREHPLFGVGLKNFPHFNIPEAIVPGRSIDINHSHSNYLQILATTGIIGLLAYLWLWLSVIVLSLRSYFTQNIGTLSVLDKEKRIAVPATDALERALALGIFGGTIALLCSGIFEYNFGAAQVRLMQWFLLAMLLPNTTKY